ncbi:MAG: hypothetical protein ACTSU3_11440 [Candidatus Thorarchaeota archaeon]
MSDQLNTQSPTKQRLSPGLVGGIIGIVAVISPIGVIFRNEGWGDLSSMIISMMWEMNYSPWGQDFQFNPFNLLGTLPLTFLRIVFVIMMIRLYQGKTTKKRTLVVGIASELQIAALFYGAMLFTMLLFLSPIPFFQIVIPIPILFAIGLLIMKFGPPAERTMWIEEEKTRSWWEPQDEESTTTTEQLKEKTRKSEETESPW